MSTLRRFSRDTRALSPVVATILLVAIAVIASVLTYLWATGFIGAIQTRPSQTTETIHIQGASYTAAGAFTIYISNAGTQAVSFTDVFLLNTAGSTLAHQTLVTAVNGPSGQVSTVSGTGLGAGAVTAGTQVILQVVTAKGTSAEITLSAS